VVAIGRDKIATHDWLVANQVPTVRQTKPMTIAEDPKSWAFPLVVKPRFGSASIGVTTVRNSAELAIATSEYDIVVQERAAGLEYTVDLYADRRGTLRCAVPRCRLEVRAGEVSKAQTVNNPVLIDLAGRICDLLPEPFGALNVQMFLAETGQPRVIEINPRFGGGFPLSWRAGADFPRWLLEEALHLPTTASPDSWAPGLFMLRYEEAVFVHQADIRRPDG
jgi:carbamoyl-phosphate synthase large subunit